MMAYTDRHFRYLLRLISNNVFLYTEMVTAHAVIYGDRHHLLHFSSEEHPVALQLGGSDPFMLAEACKIAMDFRYDEINLNVGCPSERVQEGCFGAVFMKEPERVAQCVRAMRDVVPIPITVKTRLGVDDYDSDMFLHEFIGRIKEAGCRTFIIHARKAWLKGLSPKENRDLPPLNYERVYQLKKIFPALEIIINGGIVSHTAIADHLSHVDGVMLGRVICHNPFFLAEADQTRENIVARYMLYMLREYEKGVPMRRMTRHLIGLYQGQPGARQWRRFLSETQDDHQLIKALESQEFPL